MELATTKPFAQLFEIDHPVQVYTTVVRSLPLVTFVTFEDGLA